MSIGESCPDGAEHRTPRGQSPGAKFAIVEDTVNIGEPRSSIALFVAAYCCVCGSGYPAHAANGDNRSSGKLHETQVAASSEPLIAECSYKIWIPEDTPAIRSVFVINMRAAGRRLFYKDPEWRAMASRNGTAMLYCEFEAKGVRDNGYGLSMLTARGGSGISRPGRLLRTVRFREANRLHRGSRTSKWRKHGHSFHSRERTFRAPRLSSVVFSMAPRRVYESY